MSDGITLDHEVIAVSDWERPDGGLLEFISYAERPSR
jgi:hypothetical protein